MSEEHCTWHRLGYSTPPIEECLHCQVRRVKLDTITRLIYEELVELRDQIQELEEWRRA